MNLNKLSRPISGVEYNKLVAFVSDNLEEIIKSDSDFINRNTEQIVSNFIDSEYLPVLKTRTVRVKILHQQKIPNIVKKYITDEFGINFS